MGRTYETGRTSPRNVSSRIRPANSAVCALIRMRRGLVPDQDVAELGQARRNVPMEIERAGDRQLGSDQRTDLADQGGFRRAKSFRIHGPVQPQENRVHRQRRAQLSKHPVHRFATRSLRDRSPAGGTGCHTWNDDQFRVFPHRQRVVVLPGEGIGGRLDRVKRVGLVRKAGHKYPLAESVGRRGLSLRGPAGAGTQHRGGCGQPADESAASE